MSNAELTAESLKLRLVRWGQSQKVKTLRQVLLLVGIGVVATLAKRLEPSLGIPGSSAPLWLGTLVAGRAIVRRDGAGVLMGASVAVMGIPVGLNNTFLHNLSLYGLTGLSLDIIARLPKINIRNPLGAIVCGASAHMVKFGFIIGAAYASPVTKHFLVVGLTQAALLHLTFGATAGIIGWGAYRITRPHAK
ncbi:MAG: hypothetical protein HY528_04575 [Chloroflexi bacterium]|nr:hypothetical protein [Chloroflexota bacterium]